MYKQTSRVIVMNRTCILSLFFLVLSAIKWVKVSNYISYELDNNSFCGTIIKLDRQPKKGILR